MSGKVDEKGPQLVGSGEVAEGGERPRFSKIVDDGEQDTTSGAQALDTVQERPKTSAIEKLQKLLGWPAEQGTVALDQLKPPTQLNFVVTTSAKARDQITTLQNKDDSAVIGTKILQGGQTAIFFIGQQAVADRVKGAVNIKEEVYFNGQGFFGAGISALQGRDLRDLNGKLNLGDNEREESPERLKDPVLRPSNKQNPATGLEELRDDQEYFVALVQITDSEQDEVRTIISQNFAMSLAEKHGLIVVPAMGRELVVIETSEKGGSMARFQADLHKRIGAFSPRVAFGHGKLSIAGEEMKVLIENETIAELRGMLANPDLQETKTLANRNATEIILERDPQVKLKIRTTANDQIQQIDGIDDENLLRLLRPKVFLDTPTTEEIGQAYDSKQKITIIKGPAGVGKSGALSEFIFAKKEELRKEGKFLFAMSTAGVDKENLVELKLLAKSILEELDEGERAFGEHFWVALEKLPEDRKYLQDFVEGMESSDYQIDFGKLQETVMRVINSINKDMEHLVETLLVVDDYKRTGQEAHAWLTELIEDKDFNCRTFITHRSDVPASHKRVPEGESITAKPLKVISEGKIHPKAAEWFTAIYNNGIIKEGDQRFAYTCSQEAIRTILTLVADSDLEATDLEVNPLAVLRAIRSARNLEALEADHNGNLKINGTKFETKKEEIHTASQLTEITRRQLDLLVGETLAKEIPAIAIMIEGMSLSELNQLKDSQSKRAQKLARNLELFIEAEIIILNSGHLVISQGWRTVMEEAAKSTSGSDKKTIAQELHQEYSTIGESSLVKYRLKAASQEEGTSNQHALDACKQASTQGDYQLALEIALTIEKHLNTLSPIQSGEANFMIAQAKVHSGQKIKEAQNVLNQISNNQRHPRQEAAAKLLLQSRASSALLEDGALQELRRSIREVSLQGNLRTRLELDKGIYTVIADFLEAVADPTKIRTATLEDIKTKIEASITEISSTLTEAEQSPDPRRINHLHSLAAFAHSTAQRIENELSRRDKGNDTKIGVKEILESNSSQEHLILSVNQGKKALSHLARARGLNTGGKLEADIATMTTRAAILGTSSTARELDTILRQCASALAQCADQKYISLRRSQLVAPAEARLDDLKKGGAQYSEQYQILTNFYLEQSRLSYEGVQLGLSLDAQDQWNKNPNAEPHVSATYNFIEAALRVAKEIEASTPEPREAPGRDTRNAAMQVSHIQTAVSLRKEATEAFKLLKAKVESPWVPKNEAYTNLVAAIDRMFQ